ncbi:MAG: cation-transporting P-type ATPase, partial [Planctomycetota bacterium]
MQESSGKKSRATKFLRNGNSGLNYRKKIVNTSDNCITLATDSLNPVRHRIYNNMRWHSLDLSDLVESLQTDQHRGLNKDQVAERFHQFGPNALVTIGKQAWYRVLARQFADALVIILIAAALVSLLLGDLGDAITILVIVVFNG